MSEQTNETTVQPKLCLYCGQDRVEPCNGAYCPVRGVLTHVTPQAERFQFEEWVASTHGRALLQKGPHGRYVWNRTEDYWQVWRARAKLSGSNA